MDPERPRKENWKSIRSSVFSSEIIKNILIMGYNSIIIAAVNLLFHLIMSRTLGPEDYGSLGALLNINTIILSSVSAIGYVVTRFVSYYKTRQQYDNMKFLANWAFIFFFFIGCAAFIMNIMFSRMLGDYLRISDQAVIIIFGIMVWVSFLMPIIDGILRGLQEFRQLGSYKIMDVVLKLVLASILVMIGMKVKSVITALAAASIITLLTAAYLLRKVYINKPHRIKLLEIYKFTTPVFLTMISLAVLSSIDLVLVKHYFDDTTAGFYAAAGILAKIVFGMALGSAGVLFPKIVEHYSNGESDKISENFRRAINIVLIPGSIITALLAIFPHGASRIFLAAIMILAGCSAYTLFQCFSSPLPQ